VEGDEPPPQVSDGGRMSFPQRYRYNEMAQRYAIHSDLWRKKMRIREEVNRPRKTPSFPCTRRAAHGRTRVQAPSGLTASATTAKQRLKKSPSRCNTPTVSPSTRKSSLSTKLLPKPSRSREKKFLGSLDSFAAFVKKKTAEIRNSTVRDRRYSV